MNKSNSIRKATLVAAVAATVAMAASAGVVAAPLNLPKPPLFLNSAVDPNLAVTFDDSGSMNSGYMPDVVGGGTVAQAPGLTCSTTSSRRLSLPDRPARGLSSSW